MKLIFSKAALNDLVRLREFIAEESPEAASRVASRLVGAIKKLTETPQIGRPIDSLPGEVRELILGKYVVRYQVSTNSLAILRIWHGKEDR